jgi:tetratricopeptide (TPR) repeat protein
MVALMRKQSFKRLHVSAAGLLCVSIVLATAVAAVEPDDARLQQLLVGEALFDSQQQDYLSAITRLQLAEEQGMLLSSDTRLLLAKLKLAYGMHIDAGFDFHALLGADVSDEVRNRAWYDLARTFSNKGYNEAAAEALTHITGAIPEDIVGDYQLLRATVLMSLNRNREAARELTQWRGEPSLAAYAHYNRGIALVRAGDPVQAIPALEKAVAMPAEDEELLALRDKSQLSLGYAFARLEDYDQAREHLEAVRPQGPFSNRALLALGWIAHKQGRRESALVSWMELRGRSPTDPAVLETLLVVPAVHRELDALQMASRDYEAAMTAYSSELAYLQHARESVLEGTAVSLLLQNDLAAGQETTGQAGSSETRYFGPLLASRNFQDLLQGHDELQSMLSDVDKGLDSIDSLVGAVEPADDRTARLAAPPSGTAGARESSDPAATGRAVPPLAQQRAGQGGDAEWQQQWEFHQDESTEYPAPGIPSLPEIELPDERDLTPLPESEFSGLPESDFTGLPPESEFIADLAGTDVNWLPESEILWLPESGKFRMPGDEEDYAYPDKIRDRRSRPGKRYASPVNRLIPAPQEDAGFDAGAVPVGNALRELAEALSSATQRMVRLGESLDSGAEFIDLEDRIAALRARILQLRARIANAIALYETYTQTLALNELDRRQHLLEDLLEQASLELAKTYDQSSDR